MLPLAEERHSQQHTAEKQRQQRIVWAHHDCRISCNQTSIDCTSYSLLQYKPEGIQITTGGHKSALIRPSLSSKCWLMTRAETTTKLTSCNFSLSSTHTAMCTHTAQNRSSISLTRYTVRHLRETKLLLNSSGKANHHPSLRNNDKRQGWHAK